MRTQLRLGAVVLVALLAWGCQESSDPVGPGEGSGILLDKDGSGHPHGGSGGGKDAPATFLASVATEDGSAWTPDEPQEVQSAEKKNWLHVFDSGGNGTRGAPNYDNAFFDTKIFLQPASQAGCVSDPSPLPDGLGDELFDKLNQENSIPRVFDFQVNFDIAVNEKGFSIFLFRWQDGDRTFSASTGFGLSGADDAPTLEFLGDGAGSGGAIDNPSFTRVFRISGAKVIAKELDKNKAIATLACDNDASYLVTVAPDLSQS